MSSFMYLYLYTVDPHKPHMTAEMTGTEQLRSHTRGTELGRGGDRAEAEQCGPGVQGLRYDVTRSPSLASGRSRKDNTENGTANTKHTVFFFRFNCMNISMRISDKYSLG